jgi:hypothetical protein
LEIRNKKTIQECIKGMNILFNDFNGTVGNYKGINVTLTIVVQLLLLGMQGTNKARMVEYLNATVKMLIRDN